MEDRDLLPVRYGTRSTTRTRWRARWRPAAAAARRRSTACAEQSSCPSRWRPRHPSRLAGATSGARIAHAPRGGQSPARSHESLASAPGTRAPRRAGELLRAAYLVERDGVARVRDEVAASSMSTPARLLLHRALAALQLRGAMKDKLLHRPPDIDPFAPTAAARRRAQPPHRRRPRVLERGLAQLVLTIVELLRQLMERQALRRIDAGSQTRAGGATRPRLHRARASAWSELKRRVRARPTKT